MNHTQHKFLTTAVIFIIMIMGIFLATKFNNINIGAMNLVLLLSNSLLLLITLGILLHLRESLIETSKNRRFLVPRKFSEFSAEPKRRADK